MPFALLWSLLWPLLQAAIRVILPWLIDRITYDIKAGRPTTVTADEVKEQMLARKDSIRKAYRGSE